MGRYRRRLLAQLLHDLVERDAPPRRVRLVRVRAGVRVRVRAGVRVRVRAGVRVRVSVSVTVGVGVGLRANSWQISPSVVQ